ncbi:MAG TPA: AAA family ATPase [Candidatus Paceibacterota bacterium]
MYLKSLEISGFKSFAKKSSLDFKSAVTAIVGPNGSGKSNVAEAFRFVLGEQSIKSMRGKKGEDLIWNGSEEQPRANRALVKAIFDNKKKIFNLDFDEVSIERVVNRDGVNEYSINGTQVRLKDVLELLAGAHVGASGHHIISQGEADRILTSSIKERRSMIEDALGLKVYQYKRVESERKLEKTFENISQVESLRREIAPHLRFLKKQMEKIDKALEVKDGLTQIYREYLKRESVFIEYEKANLALEKKPLFERQESLKKNTENHKIFEIEANIKKERQEKDTLSREAGRLEGEIAASQKLIDKTRREINERENITISIKEIEKLFQEIEIVNEIVEIKKIIRGFLDSKRVINGESLLKEAEESVLDLKRRKEEIERQIQEKESNIRNLESLEREVLQLSSQADVIKSQIESLHNKEERLRAIEGDFLREVEEASVLLGVAVTGFNNLDISREQILGEERKVQEERRREVERMKIRLEELGASGGEDTVKEFREATERDAFLERELADLYKSSDSLKTMIAELQDRLNTEFNQGISKINSAFQNFFELMFGGGTARLELVQEKSQVEGDLEEGFAPRNSIEEKSEVGIEIDVSLPKKRIRGLNMLSGGERALTSIALLFAMSQVNPPPFIILDETDAALDEANSRKYGDMIAALSKYSQLILITHNRETMSRAGVIYGVTMGSSGISKLLSIEFAEAVAVAK